jgi:hypothetical protein
VTRISKPTDADKVSGPLFTWMAVQTLALTLAALRVPLWARASEAGEFRAIPILLIAGVLSAALLAPCLTVNWRMTLMAIVCCWPFAVLAGLLGAATVNTILLAGGYLSAWLIVLWACLLPLETVKSRLVGAAIATTWSASGPVLLFLRLEYGSGVTPESPVARIAEGPLMYALRVVNADWGYQWEPWVVLGVVFATAITLFCGTKWIKSVMLRRWTPRSTSPPPAG